MGMLTFTCTLPQKVSARWRMPDNIGERFLHK